MDVAIHIVEGGPITWEQMRTLLLDKARAVYGAAGLQLHIVSARRIKLPDAWLELDADESSETDEPALADTAPYEYARRVKPRLSKAAERTFSAIVGGAPDAGHTINVITLRKVTMSSHQQGDGGTWKMVPTAPAKKSSGP